MTTLRFQAALLMVALSMIPGAGAGPAIAADQTQAEQESKAGAESAEQILDGKLTTRKERAEYRAMMRKTKSSEACEPYRIAQRKRMKERAKKTAKTVPEKN